MLRRKGSHIGKSDQQKTQANITEKHDQDNASTNTGIADTQSRLSALTPQSANQKNDIWSGYSGLAGDPNQGISAADRNSLLHGSGGASSSGGGSSSSGNGLTAPSGPAYLDTFRQLQGKTGGFDPTRLSNIEGSSSALRNSGSQYGTVDDSISKLGSADKNYGATETSVGGLQNFAKTGGLDSTQLESINRDSLLGLEKTGGYNEADIANERARGNSGIASTYANLQDNLNKQKMVSGQVGPGWSNAGFKLARQGAQDTASQAQKTEADIHERVNANKMAAGGKLADLGLNTAGLQSQNTLTGYKSAGELDIAKNTAIQDAWDKAGKLGLGKQGQIDAANKAAADIDNQTQSTISQSRLGAASGESQDTLGRMSIGASSGAAAAALDAANQRFLISQGSENRNTGLKGMLDTYGASPTDLQFNQSLLRGYGQDQANNSNNLIQNRIGASNIPGIGSTIGAGLNVAGQAAGMAAGGFGGLSGLLKNKVAVPASSQVPNWQNGVG